MDNKRIGTAFEKRACEILSRLGYWVHFIVPDARGAQPFDIVAARDGTAVAIDCKTCVAKTFNISRLEDNQIMSFEKWIRCRNPDPMIFVEHEGYIYCIYYSALKECKSVRLEQANEIPDCRNEKMEMEVNRND